MSDDGPSVLALPSGDLMLTFKVNGKPEGRQLRPDAAAGLAIDILAKLPQLAVGASAVGVGLLPGGVLALSFRVANGTVALTLPADKLKPLQEALRQAANAPRPTGRH